MESRGFTLIELMIVIVVIAILASVAYPSYTRYVDRAAIADGRSALLSAAHQLERCFTRTDTYVGCAVRATSEEGFYTLEDSVPRSATTYMLAANAVPSNARPATCRNLTLNQTGARLPNNCW
jgi:type IV pilus assembly protein PilE